MPKTLRVLSIEDSQRDAALIKRQLAGAGFDMDFERVDTPLAMMAALGAKDWDVILSDYSMPEFSAIEALALLKRTGRDIPFIIISGTIGEELAVEAMRAGAGADYLMKGKMTRLVAAIEREVAEANNRQARRRAEAEAAHLSAQIQRQRDRLNTIIATVPGIVWESWTQPDIAAQQIDFVSDYVETMLGYSAQEWLATATFADSVIHPDDRERVARDAAENFKSNKSSTQEFRCVANDDSVVWVESSSIVISDENAQSLGTRGVTIDISERKRAEEELRVSEERYRCLFESNPDPTFVFEQETLQIIAFNQAAVQEYGYTPEELFSMKSKDLCPPSEIPTFIARLVEKPGGPPQGTTLTHKRKSGALIDVEISRHALAFSGKPAWVMLARNVTDRRLLEEQLRQSQKMEAVGELAGGVAHDFNNLLTVINGYSDLILNRLGLQDPLRPDIEQILGAGERAAALTGRLLAFSRKQVVLPTIFDLNPLVSELTKLLLRIIGENIKLHTDLFSDTGNIKADRGQIEQVVMNLVVNARDAMLSGGNITIETQNVELGENCTRSVAGVDPGSYVMLAVSDTGSGMDSETQKRIFEPFFTTKETGKGTGLGLSIVYGIVRQAGGAIRVYSELGRGTTFRIYLPRIYNSSQVLRVATPGAMPKGTETVVLTEDDSMVRALARRVLSSQGYRVLEAENGEDALSICDRYNGTIHLLISDMVMPGLSTRDLVDTMMKRRPGIKVLYISGYADRAMLHPPVLDETTPFLQKPFAPQALLRKVREIIDQTVLPARIENGSP